MQGRQGRGRQGCTRQKQQQQNRRRRHAGSCLGCQQDAWRQPGRLQLRQAGSLQALTHLTLLHPLQRQSPGRAIRPGCRPGSADTATSSPASPVLGLPTPHLLHCSRHWKLQGEGQAVAQEGRGNHVVSLMLKQQRLGLFACGSCAWQAGRQGQAGRRAADVLT